MNFHFRMDRVLHFVALKEDMKKMEVAALIRKLSDLMRIKARTLEGIRKLLEANNQALSVDEIQYNSERIDADTAGISDLENRINETRELLDGKRLELSRVSQKKRALESLKDKRHHNYRIEEARRVQRETDENYRLQRAVGK